MTPRATIKTWFETGDYPTQAQFAELIDSLFHANEDSLLISHITGLQDALDSKQPVTTDPEDVPPVELADSGTGVIIIGDITVHNSARIDYTIVRGTLTEIGTMTLTNKADTLVARNWDFDDAGFSFEKSISGNALRLSWTDDVPDSNNGYFYITRLVRTKIQ